MNILIVGDSFAAPSNEKYTWYNRLSQKHTIKNIAEAGVGEYKILKQIESQLPLEECDRIIMVHTSPFRIHTHTHPVHKSGSHSNCDLLYADLEHHASQLVHTNNRSLYAALSFIEYHFDIDYYKEIYTLIRNKIKTLTKAKDTIDLCAWDDGTILHSAYYQHPGKVNHLSEEGHRLVYDHVR